MLNLEGKKVRLGLQFVFELIRVSSAFIRRILGEWSGVLKRLEIMVSQLSVSRGFYLNCTVFHINKIRILPTFIKRYCANNFTREI